jgi:hypothetical protein
MTPGWFALVVLTAGAFATAPGAIVLQLFFCLFGATAAFELTALGGAPVLPAVAFLPFLLRRAWSERLRLPALRMPPAGFWLLLTVGWAVFSALVVPRLLSGTVAVKTYDRTGRDDAITVLLRPVSGNITQSAYALIDVLVFFSMRVLLARKGRMAIFARGVLLLAAANCFAAIVGLAEYYAGFPKILEAIRSAKYTVFETYELAGVARVQGTFSEAAVFSMFTLPLFAFTSSLWFSRAFASYSGYLALGSLVLLLISTSGTAYVGLSVYLGLVSIGLAWRLFTKGTVPRLESLFVAGAVAAAGICAVLVSSPEVVGRVAAFVDATVLRKLSSSSGLDRSAANQLAWTDFLGTYGLGVGLGSTRASSFAMVLLSNLGVLGGFAFAAFLVNVVRSPAADDSLDSVVARSARQAVIASIIAACVVGTVFDLGIAFYCFAATATMTLERDAIREKFAVDRTSMVPCA